MSSSGNIPVAPAPEVVPQNPKELKLDFDYSIFQPDEVELEFLKSTISSNDAELQKRIVDTKDKIYAEFPYGCIVTYGFAKLTMRENVAYPEIVERGKTDPTALFLDLGCCIGTDVRKLMYDGYPGSQIAGSDLREFYITTGHELFSDTDQTCPIHFFTSDIFTVPIKEPSSFDPPPFDRVTDASDLRGRLTHIYTGRLFHLFTEETQKALALRLALLLKRVPGAIIFGVHQGSEVEGVLEPFSKHGSTRYGHSCASWERLWHEVFAELEGETFSKEKVEVKVIIDKREKWLTHEDPTKTFDKLVWSVHIL